MAIDVRPAAAGRVGGTATYVDQLVRALIDQCPDLELVLLAGPAGEAHRLTDIAEHAAITWVPTSMRPAAARMQVEIPKLLSAHAVDVFHSPGSFLPLAWRGPSVLTVHDLRPASPLSGSINALERARRLEAAASLPVAILRATVRVAVSEHVAAGLRRLPGVAPATVFVTPGAPDPFFDAPDDPAATAEAAALHHGDPLVLCVGELSPRKNLVLLLEAFAATGLGARGGRLMLVGPDRGGYAAHLTEVATGLDIGAALSLPGVVPPALLRALYRRAWVVVLPSRNEGFGLPAVEAMAAGGPLLAARAGALPEVVGDAAVLFDPKSLGDLATAMARLCASADVRRDLVARGLVRRQAFSWAATARATAKAYRAAAARQ